MNEGWLQLVRDKEFMQAIINIKFRKNLKPKHIYHVIYIVLQTVSSYPANKIFEGFSQFTTEKSHIIIGFYFSLDPNHISKIEKDIGHQDLTTHRLRLIYNVMLKIDSHYEIYDDNLPAFRILGDIGYLL